MGKSLLLFLAGGLTAYGVNRFLSGSIKKELHTMAEHLNELTLAVRRNTSTIGSAAALIHGLSDKLRECASDPAAVKALAAELDDATETLAAALVQNTPSEDEEDLPENTDPDLDEDGDQDDTTSEEDDDSTPTVTNV